MKKQILTRGLGTLITVLFLLNGWAGAAQAKSSSGSAPASTVPTALKPSQTLPPAIQTLMQTQVDQGVCEARWADLADDLGVIQQQVDQNMKLWFVPCALWAVNQAWSVYLVIDEPEHVGGFITKPIHFVNYSVYEGLIAQDVVHGINWNPSTLTLSTQYHPNGNPACGSRAEYRWDNGYENFELTRLSVQGDCKSASQPWTTIAVPAISK